jgi:DNA modification methylase
MRKEVIGDAVLYLGDCMDIMPDLARVHAVVTDPPYGIRADENPVGGLKKKSGDFYGNTSWDRDRPPRAIFDLIRQLSDHQIIWGGNYFTDYLPPTMQWLIWDKDRTDFSLADFEMAWSSQQRAARRIVYPMASAYKEGTFHPTQKPILIMEWTLDHLPDGVSVVLDPFMGSGTTGVAALKKGMRFVGIEREERYFEVCCQRIAEAQKQDGLF